MTEDVRLFAPATERNRDAILAALRDILPARGVVLEVASGSGEHVMHFAAALPGLTFQPSDHDPAALASIDAWARRCGLTNVAPALALDASGRSWPVAQADAVLCINMVHISPWSATEGLFANAARVLQPGAALVLYGPFDRPGVPRVPSNDAFDADLRARDPRWGLRDLDAVIAIATGFARPVIIEMPANNLIVVFRRLQLGALPQTSPEDSRPLDTFS